jgi:hypothetical protein
VFPGTLVNPDNTATPPVSNSNFQGIWESKALNTLTLLARSGSAAPGAGGSLFDILPVVPAIDDSGEVTLLAALRLGTGNANASNVMGVWTEIGGGGLNLLMRQGDSVGGNTVMNFGTGVYATAHTGATSGELAFSVTFGASNTNSAILRTSVTGASANAATKTVTVLAQEGTAAPGTGLNFGPLAGSYSDPVRMDAAGDVAFAAVLSPGNLNSIWYQPVGGALSKVFVAGDTAPGTTGATFKSMERPAMGGGGVMCFRGFLNTNGDNASNSKNDGIWKGTGSNTAGYAPLLRRGDTVSGLKVGNVWGGWLSNANHFAGRAWVNINGNGAISSTANGDVHGLYTDASGTMVLAVKVGDSAPGITGASFSSFDLPIIGGAEQMAFLGKVTGTGITAGVNDKGIWRQAANGGALSLVLRAGDTMVTSQGSKTIANIDFPGTTQGSTVTDHRMEQTIMDGTGRLVLFITFTDGTSSEVLAP